MTDENTLPIPLFTVYDIYIYIYPILNTCINVLELKTVPFNIEMVIDINDAKEMHFIVNRKCILAYTIAYIELSV